jgi:hypothetical protein
MRERRTRTAGHASPPTSSSTAPVVSIRLQTYLKNAISDNITGDLEIEGIVERPPSPAPPVKIENRDPADLTLDEAREQLRLLRAREAANNIKQEFQRENRKRERSVTSGQENGSEKDNNDRDDDEVTITAEWDRRKRAKASAEGAEVIDLTED